MSAACPNEVEPKNREDQRHGWSCHNPRVFDEVLLFDWRGLAQEGVPIDLQPRKEIAASMRSRQ
jgi:hypothetical protein